MPRRPESKRAGGQSPPHGAPIPGGAAQNPTTLSNGSRSHRQYILALLLVGLTIASFWRLGSCDFVNYDDDTYVYQNPQIRAGLSWEGIAWAFRSSSASNWHPLTWMSHMLDVQLFDLRAGRHHIVNLAFHCANAAMLLLLLFRMTGALWRSAFVAALFALHPLHVESVAWIAERKDVLSTFFLFLTIISYAAYVRRPGRIRYLTTLVLFALGLMSKPMLITLPFLLLLLDWWPLGRITRLDWGHISRLVREKAPLLVLSAVSCVVTFWAQAEGEAVLAVPLGARVANAFVSYLVYLVKTVWPSSLAVFYPHPWMVPGGEPGWRVAGAAVFIAIISALVLIWTRSHPYLAIGWLWYLGTLVPVIGFVQVGAQSMADRYSYVPLIGIFIVIAWGSSDIFALLHIRREFTAISAAIVLLAFSIATWHQTSHWYNSTTLFAHALSVTDHNWVACYNLASALEEQGKLDESIRWYRQALQDAPYSAKAHNNLGLALALKKKYGDAVSQFRESLRLTPNRVDIHVNLGNALAALGDFDGAISQYRQALNLDPKFADAYSHLGDLLIMRGEVENAIANYRSAATLDPRSAPIHNNLGNALAALGNLDEAAGQYLEALRLDPQFATAYRNLADLLSRRGDFQRAIDHYRSALRLSPRDPSIYNGLGNALSKVGNNGEAIVNYREAIRIDPEYAEAYCNLGLALAKDGKMDEAVANFRSALKVKPDFPPALKYLELAVGKK